MGTIAQLFESGEQKSNEGIFKNLVMIARVDGKIDEAEMTLLKRKARRLSLSEDQISEIIKHPEQYPMYPPVTKEERYERYIQFIEMTLVDGVVDEAEEKLVAKYGIELGFEDEDAHGYADIIFNMLKAGSDRDEILEELM
jgi:uncharacterized membrane protein YebE (DUF533 family)